MTQQPLSADALRLLQLLRRHRAFLPPGAPPYQAAVTDERLADELQIHKRLIVDLAGELLRARFLVIALTGAPGGRYLLEPGDDLAPARKYYDVLTSRTREIIRRRRELRLAIRHAEHQAVGQTTLDFGPPPDALRPTSERLARLRR